MADDLVLTAGGLRPPFLVHKVEAGASPDGALGQLRMLHLTGGVFGLVRLLPGMQRSYSVVRWKR